MGIGLFGDCQSTNLRPVNHYFPQIARRTFFMPWPTACRPASTRKKRRTCRRFFS